MKDYNQILNFLFFVIIGFVIGFYIGKLYSKIYIYGGNNCNEILEEINRMTQSPLLH
jgi:hypothetical protein